MRKAWVSRLAKYGITEKRCAEALRKGEKWCWSGKHFKSASEFNPSEQFCRECAGILRRRRYLANREAQLAYNKRPENRKRASERQKIRWHSLPTEERQWEAFKTRLVVRYKVTIGWFAQKFEEQKGKCAVCGKGPGNRKRFAVDHDHNCCPGRNCCGKCVRGLVCDKCNLYVGMLEKIERDHSWAVAARIYLAKYKESNMPVDEKAIQARRDEIAAAGTLSAQAIEAHEAALAHLRSQGLSHDQATLELQQKGADAVLAEKAATVVDAPQS